MGGFTSMIKHHLPYALLPYQLLSPPNIPPLENDHCMQHISMEWIHSDNFIDTYSCVTYVWFHINDMTSLTLSLASILAPVSTKYSTIDK